MRITKLIVLLAIMLLLPGTALANPQEQFILNQISVGHFDVWQHTNGTWQDTDRDGKADPYGQTGKRVTETYTYPQSQYASQFTPTRVEITKITQASNLTDDELRNAGRSETWADFNLKYLTKLPNNYSVAKTSENMAQGTVTVQRTFDLAPKLLNLKDPTVRAELGMTDRDFSDLAQGWRWYTPVLIKWYGVPKNQINLVASSIDPGIKGEAEPGKQYTGSVTFKYFGKEPVTNVPIGVFNGQWQATLKNSSGKTVTVDNFNPNDIKTYTFTWTAPSSGGVTLTGAISIVPPLSKDPYPNETTKEDNKVSTTVMVKEEIPPPAQSTGPGSLKLTSVSQDRKVTRPAGTTKWTDWITADFKAPSAPDLSPCYDLIKWELKSATIEYPKVHPEFTFGSPYEPQGTVTKSMVVNSENNTATIEFKEDWSLNGANIYDVLRGKMVPGPTYYPIKVSYVINWEYRKGQLSCCGEDECNPCCINYQDYKKTVTDTIKTQILVNGSGVNSLAQ